MILLMYQAKVTCEHTVNGRTCPAVAEVGQTIESARNADDFGDNAARTFRAMGWRVFIAGNGPHNLCPKHA